MDHLLHRKPEKHYPTCGSTKELCNKYALWNYLYDNDLNESLLSAYKEQHSCKTALLRVQDDILKRPC